MLHLVNLECSLRSTIGRSSVPDLEPWLSAGHYALSVNDRAAAVAHFRLAAGSGPGVLASVNAALAEVAAGDAAAAGRAVDELQRHNLHTLSVSSELPTHER